MSTDRVIKWILLNPTVAKVLVGASLLSPGLFFALLGSYNSLVSGKFTSELPPVVLLDRPALGLGLLIFLFVVLIALMSLVGMSYRNSTRTQFETQAGVLRNGTEPNISFRVETFKALLVPLIGDRSQSDIRQLFLEAGREAGHNFAHEFPTEIYTALTGQGAGNWAAHSMRARLRLWARYDTETGWGEIQAIMQGHNRIHVEYLHPDLFGGGRASEAVGYFMAGYSETVLRGLLKDKYGVRLDPNSVELDGPAVTFDCALLTGDTAGQA